jgi:hypothetical protein
MAKGRRLKGGRPRKNGARRNCALIRRAPVRDLGTREVQRLRQLLNGRLDLPTTPLASPYSRGFIERPPSAGCRFAASTALARGGWGFQDGSVQDLWRLLVAEGSHAFVRTTNGHDHTLADTARMRLAEMRAELLRGDKDGAILSVVISVCVDGSWLPWIKRLLTNWSDQPVVYRHLSDLKEGLHRLVELGTSRRRLVSSARAEAAE